MTGEIFCRVRRLLLKLYTAKLVQIWIENSQKTIEMLRNHLDVNQVSVMVSEKETRILNLKTENSSGYCVPVLGTLKNLVHRFCFLMRIFWWITLNSWRSITRYLLSFHFSIQRAWHPSKEFLCFGNDTCILRKIRKRTLRWYSFLKSLVPMICEAPDSKSEEGGETSEGFSVVLNLRVFVILPTSGNGNTRCIKWLKFCLVNCNWLLICSREF